MSKEIHSETTLNILDKMDEFLKLYDEIANYQKGVINHQSDMDKELADVYHIIEGVVPKHISQSHKIFLHLKNVLNRRRMSKLPTQLVQMFIDNLGPKIEVIRTRHKSLMDKHQMVLDQIDENQDIHKVFKSLDIK